MLCSTLPPTTTKARTTAAQNKDDNTQLTINDNITMTKDDIRTTATQTTMTRIPETPTTSFLTTKPSTANAPMTTWPTNTTMKCRHQEKTTYSQPQTGPTTIGVMHDDRANKDLTYEDMSKANRVNADKKNYDTTNKHNAHRANLKQHH